MGGTHGATALDSARAQRLADAICTISQRFSEDPSVEGMVDMIGSELTGDPELDARICAYGDYTLLFFLNEKED